jgi:hypothetical protein
LAIAREKQHDQIVLYQRTPLHDGQADQAIMQMYRQIVINLTRIADVVEQFDHPTHDWGDKSAWRLLNAATFALTGRVAENPGVTSTLHKIIDGVCERLH